MSRSAAEHRRSLNKVPGAARLMYLGVLCTFAPIGCLLGMINTPPAGWFYGLLLALVSGGIAVAWSYTFISGRMWLLALVIPAQVLVPLGLFSALARLGMLGIGTGIDPQWRLLILAVMAVALTTVGFVLGTKVVRRLEGASARARTELELAKRVHESLVPELSVKAGAVEVFGRSEPSSEMGGDLIDAVVRDGEVDVFVADVSGHGVSAGVVMGMVKSSIRSLIRARPSLEALLGDLNGVLSDLTTPDMFATFACLRIAPGGASAEYALAGHLPIMQFVSAGGGLVELPNDRLPLGIDADEKYATGRVRVGAGDTFVLFTDGLVEVLNASGRQLGIGSLRDTFVRHARDPLRTLHGALIGAARAHGAQADDQSVVLVRVG